MELSERIIATLESQGYDLIEEYQYTSGARNNGISPVSPIIIYVTDGSVDIVVGGVPQTLSIGERIIIPPLIPYSFVALARGCQLVIGEKSPK